MTDFIKYLKYKKKYVALKNNIIQNGGALKCNFCGFINAYKLQSDDCLNFECKRSLKNSSLIKVFDKEIENIKKTNRAIKYLKNNPIEKHKLTNVLSRQEKINNIKNKILENK